MSARVLMAAVAALIGTSAIAQDPVAPADERVVEGQTPDRERLMAQCAGHKFETYVQTDAATKRAKRIKLCANPGASDAEWVTTLKSAIEQVENQPFPAAAKAQLTAELEAEIAKFNTAKAVEPIATASAASGLVLDPEAIRALDAPNDRFETSTLPSLDRPSVVSGSAPLAGGGASVGSAAAVAVPTIPMRARATCLEPGERGEGMTCDFLRADTILLLKAQEGLEKGARIRFLRRGEPRGEVMVSALQKGQATKVRLPAELCRGVKSTKVEVELLPTDSRGRVAGRLGPYGLRC